MEVIRNGCLTMCEPRRVIVDISKCNRDGGGAGEAAHLTHHVFSLNDQHILVSCLPVHVGQSCSDDTCKGESEKGTKMNQESQFSFLLFIYIFLFDQHFSMP